ncbi:MAG: HAD-IIIA family hydrolase [Tatlockia sp.]|jgi:imidazoleglycerol-phosphate dehydratase/histidinol-phosphatase
MQRVLFIDRCGTLIEESCDNSMEELSEIQFIAGVIPALLALSKAGYRLVMLSDHAPALHWQTFLIKLFKSQGIHFSEVLICPHHRVEQCKCPKPNTGLLDSFLMQNAIDRSKTWVIGDEECDKELALNLGVSYLPRSEEHGWPQIAETILQQKRFASLRRQTAESTIDLRLSLNDQAPVTCIKTPIPFFSHMVEQIAKQGGFSLHLEAKDDTDLDYHHLIEDTGATLGEALKQALGNKEGLARYGFLLPQDESLAFVSLDLCGRSFCAFEGQFTREFVGGLATEMIPLFFHSFANSLNATLHIKVTGQNHHHMIEATFKGLGRALNQAIRQEHIACPVLLD